METKFNVRNPAVKRIMQEMKEMQEDESCDFIAEALEGNIFEWHFSVRGPPDTEFEGGIYHGRILLPAEYPFKPPSFMMLTPSGRFETNVKICLSISSYHPEHWQPSWSVRTALTALIAFMPSPGNGALGSLDFTKDERKILAAKARRDPPVFGSSERQKVIEDIHQRMLKKPVSVKSTGEGKCAEVQEGNTAVEPSPEAGATDPVLPAPPQPGATEQKGTLTQQQSQQGLQQGPVPKSDNIAEPPMPSPPSASTRAYSGGVLLERRPSQQLQQARVAQAQSADHGLTMVAVALVIAIGAILMRKVFSALDFDLNG